MLPQQQQFFPQFVFHLYSVQVRRDLQALKNVLPKEHAMMLHHIEQFDREDIRRSQ